MRAWERSLVQALGRIESAHAALAGVGGHIVPQSVRDQVLTAQRALEAATRELQDISREHEDCDYQVPWEKS